MSDKKLHLKRLMFSIASLVDLGQEATSSKDLMTKMKAALFVITGTLSVPTAALFVYQPKRYELDLVVSKGHQGIGADAVRLGA
ncbi:MAG TPA: hypothetical protein VEJ22_00720, partial [Nitrospirota bacterium]|nr:hypothetical protein [Nitrospirota bacterium]